MSFNVTIYDQGFTMVVMGDIIERVLFIYIVEHSSICPKLLVRTDKRYLCYLCNSESRSKDNLNMLLMLCKILFKLFKLLGTFFFLQVFSLCNAIM